MPPALPANSPNLVPICAQIAEVQYSVPACIVRAIHVLESSGRTAPGLVRQNANGTEDHGDMQINDVWANTFQRKFGISRADLSSDLCLSMRAAGYVVRYEINRTGDFWKGVGNFHSRTPALNYNYAMRVSREATRFGCQIK